VTGLIQEDTITTFILMQVGKENI